MPVLTPYDFAHGFGVDVESIPTPCLEMIASMDFRYRVVDGAELRRLLAAVFKRIDSGNLTMAGAEARDKWERGWRENLESFRSGNKLDVSTLVPRYIRERLPLRFCGEYIIPECPNFELNWFIVFRRWLFLTYLPGAEALYEFGCGTGFNLAETVSLFPNLPCVGLDWAVSSRDIVDEMAASFGWPMRGRVFDFFRPDESLEMPPGAVVLTIGALEQTGKNWGKFLDFLIQKNPSLVVNVEPIVEWYREEDIIDYAAIRFHRARNYWEGFPARIWDLAAEGKVEVIKHHRSNFGSQYIEGYSQFIWRPL